MYSLENNCIHHKQRYSIFPFWLSFKTDKKGSLKIVLKTNRFKSNNSIFITRKTVFLNIMIFLLFDFIICYTYLIHLNFFPYIWIMLIRFNAWYSLFMFYLNCWASHPSMFINYLLCYKKERQDKEWKSCPLV